MLSIKLAIIFGVWLVVSSKYRELVPPGGPFGEGCRGAGGYFEWGLGERLNKSNATLILEHKHPTRNIENFYLLS